ncbi:MAG: Ig-like domain-containing protein [Bacilli bacterium]
MDIKSLYEENKKNIVILGGIIILVLIFIIVFSGLNIKKEKAKISEIKFLKDEYEVEENKTYQIEYNVYPQTITGTKLTWSSTDETIAKVDDTGLVTAIKPGSVVIVASSNKITDNINIHVITDKRDETSVKFNIENFDLKINTYRRLYPMFIPENLNYQSIVWTSSNENIATVTQVGRVNGIKEGNAIITATVKLEDSTYLSTSSNVIITKKTTLSLAKSSSLNISEDETKEILLSVSDNNVVIKQIVGETSNNNVVQIIKRPISNINDSTISLLVKGIGKGKAKLDFTMETVDGEIVTLIVPIVVK